MFLPRMKNMNKFKNEFHPFNRTVPNIDIAKDTKNHQLTTDSTANRLSPSEI